MTDLELTEKCHAVCQASLELIAEQGFHGTPMSQIAKQAGVGVGSIYRYFKDKDDLIHGIHVQVDKRLVEALNATDVEGLSEKEEFLNLILTLARHFIANPLEFKFLEQYYNSPYGVQMKREKFFDELPDDAAEKPFTNLLKGESFKDLPMPILHALAFGPLVFGIRDHHSGIQLLDDEMLKELAEGCWDAVRK